MKTSYEHREFNYSLKKNTDEFPGWGKLMIEATIQSVWVSAETVFPG